MFRFVISPTLAARVVPPSTSRRARFRRPASDHQHIAPGRFFPQWFRQAIHEVARLMRWSGLLGLAMLAQGSPAFAHAYPRYADPPADSVTADSPSELTITFTGGVESSYSTIEVRDSSGAAVSTGKAHVAAGNNRLLSVALPKLPPGTYTVIWHATSVDTHKTEGSYKFTIAH